MRSPLSYSASVIPECSYRGSCHVDVQVTINTAGFPLKARVNDKFFYRHPRVNLSGIYFVEGNTV